MRSIIYFIDCKSQQLYFVSNKSINGGLGEKDIDSDTVIILVTPDFCDSIRYYLSQSHMMKENHRIVEIDSLHGFNVFLGLTENDKLYQVKYASIDNLRDIYHVDSFAHKACLLIYRCHKFPVREEYVSWD